MADPMKTGIPETPDAQRELLNRLFDPEAGGKLAEADLVTARAELFGNRVREAARPQDAESAPGVDARAEVLAECLKRLEVDYNRGIVVVNDKGTVDDFKAALKKDKTAGTSLEQVRTRLSANNYTLLKKTVRMQGGGELIGVDTKGELVIISRADKQGNREPERFGFGEAQIEGSGDQRKPKAGEKPILINTDTPDREALMTEIGKSGLFADYWERRNAVHADGFTLPPDSHDREKKGIVAAVEAVTGGDFVRSANGDEWRSADLDCGDVPKSANVRVVYFDPADECADVHYDSPKSRSAQRGAVRVLRG